MTNEQILGQYHKNDRLINRLDARNWTPCREIRYLHRINRIAYENEIRKIGGLNRAEDNNHSTTYV